MPLLKAEADKLSNNDLQRGVIEEIIDHDEMFALLPFGQTMGKAYVYNRENTIGEDTVDFLDPNDVITESGATFTEITTKLRVIASDVDVDNFIRETEGDTNDQFAIQIAAKAKALGRVFRNALINGDNSVNTKQFDGLNRLVSVTGNQFATAINGAALSLDMLDELLDLVDHGADVLMMNRRTLRQLKVLWRAAGGNTGGLLQIENFGTVPAHDGTPIIVNDFIPNGVTQGSSTTTTSVYALRMNEVDGLHGLWGGASGGIRVEDIGPVQNKDARRTRLKWYCGLALKSTKSAAALRGVEVGV